MTTWSECPSAVRSESVSLGQQKLLLHKAYSHSVRVSELNPYFDKRKNKRDKGLAATDTGRTHRVNERAEWVFNSVTRTDYPKHRRSNVFGCPSGIRLIRTEPPATSRRLSLLMPLAAKPYLAASEQKLADETPYKEIRL